RRRRDRGPWPVPWEAPPRSCRGGGACCLFGRGGLVAGSRFGSVGFGGRGLGGFSRGGFVAGSGGLLRRGLAGRLVAALGELLLAHSGGGGSGGLAFQHGVGGGAGVQLHGADGVVVAGDGVV